MRFDLVELREPITLLGKPTTTVAAADVDILELSETHMALVVSKYPETHWVPWSNVKSGRFKVAPRDKAEPEKPAPQVEIAPRGKKR